ncbi:MAG: hypothetical protein QXT77_06530 [Candidatus Methanomethylicaceae archaeon]
MRDKTRKEILREVGEQIKAVVKELLERLMREERALYLAENPAKANGYYTRDLLTLTGPLEDLKVLRVREGDFVRGSSSTDGVRPWSFRKLSWASMLRG